MTAATNLRGGSHVDNELTVPPATVTGPEKEPGIARSDGVFISSAAQIYLRFVNRVRSVLEEFVEVSDK